ncbi:hypothetical protein DPMN_129014 [Dreissena polymorpha]|uniref:Uncharacterized protein n=1 Tax=Dreissena polymorpha TaxID=45954 RepID=A0A9D4H3Y3_DREPO|nr:hypothetical protein DPMN_129014 [Dreissena polymorpha]
MDTVESVSWEEAVLGVYAGDNENTPSAFHRQFNGPSVGCLNFEIRVRGTPEIF